MIQYKQTDHFQYKKMKMNNYNKKIIMKIKIIKMMEQIIMMMNSSMNIKIKLMMMRMGKMNQ